ncbi:transmembrane protein 218 [Xyrauchen texanus]|uniref:transmembrane protein 218 n=1 Tax=Xyrauchen texanus TaxID=154827 RepID=UPI0022422A6B|nr:transmembrane protein 218 [Xyrauchen texanus]XP_051972383.1 transmembrane protein 218 [Xyrauchen texanus]
MAEVVLGVGTGVFILALIWIVTLALAIILSRATGATKLGIIPIFLLALTISLVLVFFPRAPEVPTPETKIQIVDMFFIGRYVLLSLASVVFLAALFMLLPLHFLEPVYAKPLRTH